MKTVPQVEKLLGALPAATLPVALLPVQVQTRYVTRGGKPVLLVRVFPDELHLDAHEPRLTAAEVAWGKKAWQLAWPANRDKEAERLAWTQLAERFGARRAEWIARRLRPTNLKDRPKAPPKFPAPGALRTGDDPPPTTARHLPDRWVVSGYQAGQRVLLEVGKPIAAALPVGPAFDDTPPQSGPGGLPLDPGMTWLVDFDAAERIGMGIRVALTPELATGTLDALLVLGLNAKLTPEAGATGLEALLDAQRYTRGLAFVAPGTATNNTAEGGTGFTRRDRKAGPSFESVPAAVRSGSAASVAARLLGIRPAILAGVENAERTDELDARHLQTALWHVTGGYYLDQIMGSPAGQPATFSEAQLAAARRHFVDLVRGLGPAPMLRAGRQPYGVLPVTSLELFPPGPGARGRFVRSLRFLRGAWTAALANVPRVAADPDALVEVLRLQPTSVGYSARLAFDTEFFAPTTVFASQLSSHLQGHGTAIHARLQPAATAGLVAQERFFDLIPDEISRPLRAPLVSRGGEAPGRPLAANYISFLRTATFDDLINERFPAGFPPKEQMDSLLYLLLRHSVLLAYGNVARRILVRQGLFDARFREPTLVDITGGTVPDTTPTLIRALLKTGLGASIHTLGKAQDPEAAELDELRASLKYLEALPVDALERQLRGCLDLFAYRLDAWITSLATRRLGELRAQAPRKLVLGAFGWVQNLKASPRTVVAAPPGETGELFAAREPGGFLHAPSQAQASAAAVLRSGYLQHMGEAGSGQLAIDLSSSRVRLAESLLDGVRQGQQLGSLLGYRFERALHERQLDRFIAGFRRVSLLGRVYTAKLDLDLLTGGIGFPPPDRVEALKKILDEELTAVRKRLGTAPDATIPELEPVAAASVTDGFQLVQALHGRGIRFEKLGVPLGSDRPKLDAEISALDQAVDALGDALTAEGVFQLVRGNPARAAASVDAIAHGEIQPPELEFAQTPRSGTALTHRLVALFSGAPPAAATGARKARQAAEPKLDAWLAQMVGEPKTVRLSAQVVDASGTVLAKRNAVRLDLLGVSNLDALYLSASSSAGAPSDLERLLEHVLLRDAPAGATAVRLARERGAGFAAADLSLAEFLELNAAFRAAVLSARTLDAPDFHEDGLEIASAADVAELAKRADRAVATLKAARDTLVKRITAPDAPGPLRDALVDFVFLGIPEAVPVSAKGADENLVAQARTIEAEAGRRLAQVQALATGFDPKAVTPDLRVKHEQARLEAVFGRGFKALPLVRPKNAAELGAAFGRSDALLGGDPLEALSWLQGASRVRPGAGRLSAALTYAAALRRNAALALKVAQLPSAAAERWVGLPSANGGAPVFPPGKLSLVAHLPQAFRPAQPLGGLVFDEWVEVVPAAEVTTGVAFNYDAPGARPPQTILLAACPPGIERWRVEVLEQILLETLELAQLRAVDPQALGGDVLMQRALPALYVTGGVGGGTFSTDFLRAAN